MERDSKGRFIKKHKVSPKSIEALIKNNYKSKRFGGKNHTKDSKDKIGLAQKGNEHAKGNKVNKTSFKKGQSPWNKGLSINLNPEGGFKKGNVPWNKGKHIWKNGNHPKGMLGKKAWNKGLEGYKSGDKHYNWKGGKVTKRKGKEWRKIREKILIRFDFKCLHCGDKNDLIIHHKIPYRQIQEHLIENLIPLCRSCHGKEESKITNNLIKTKKL